MRNENSELGCLKCGKKNVNDAIFCLYCGEKLAENGKSEQIVSSDKATLKPIKIFSFIMILVVTVSIVAVIVFLISSSKTPKTMSATNSWDIVVDAQKPDYNGYVKQYYEQVTFVIDNQEHNDDGTGTAEVTVTTPDMRIILEEVLSGSDNGHYILLQNQIFHDGRYKQGL